ncbi:MAG: glycyl-radical enzyme activating protein [Planctomycetes bacterium]|nr:glycyl-radical enzyme activating protein [Planctomycetota bacterium]
MQNKQGNVLGSIFHIQEYSVQDGMGIRTTVFLKGCPLQCRWCANPEGQSPHSELMHSKVLCKKHYYCISKCPHGGVFPGNNGYPEFKREICKSCTERVCERACPERAIRAVGKYWTPESLYKKVSAYSLFYRNSRGGVTLSGGEPFAQPEFVEAFVNICKEAGLSVGVETCGLFDWDRVKTFITKFDFFYFDIKCLDTKIHRIVTGCGNEEILKNLARLAEIDPCKIIVTIPVIPGVNTSEEMVAEIGDHCRKLHIEKIRLLPYHPFGEFKYNALGREYLMPGNLSVNQSYLENYRTILLDKGVDCWIE